MATRPEQPAVAVVGATGLVGRELVEILGRDRLGEGQVRLFASTRSAGVTIPFRGAQLPVEVAGEDVFPGVDLAFFCAGGETSRALVPAAVKHGVVVIDNSSAFRMQTDVPLVVPEINGNVLDDFRHPGVIANPNCSTIIALMAVTPLHRAVGIERMVIATYQAASGAGAGLLAELEQQTRDHVEGRPYTQEVMDRPSLFNVFSHDSAIGPDGYNEEEAKLARETHKIWNDDSVRITATCVRVPVRRAHSEAINLTFKQPLSEDDARALIAEAPGVRIVDDRAGNRFPEPVDASGIDDVLVGRIRGDRSQPPGLGLDLFVSGDQLLKGAALNAVQIANRVFAAQGSPAEV